MELAVEIVRVVRRRIEYAAKWPMEWLPSVLLLRNSIHRVVTIYEQLVPLPFDPHPRLPQEEDEFIPRDSRGFMRTFLEGDRFERKTVGEMHLGMFLISNWIETRGYSFLTFGNIKFVWNNGCGFLHLWETQEDNVSNDNHVLWIL